MRPGEPFPLLVRAVDAWGNPAAGSAGAVALAAPGIALPQVFHTFSPAGAAVWWLEGCAAQAPGVHRVEATGGDDRRTLTARSNPVRCAEASDAHRIYWGDPHGGQIADAAKIPDFFRYARDVAGIAFAGYQRNDHVHSNADYAAQQAAERAFDEPGPLRPPAGLRVDRRARDGRPPQRVLPPPRAARCAATPTSASPIGRTPTGTSPTCSTSTAPTAAPTP